MTIRAVIFDLGGVVLDSPLHAIARYENDLGIPRGFINQVVMETGPAGAWSRLERGELSMEAFQLAFQGECDAAGHTISGADLMLRISECRPRPEMVHAIRRIRARSLGVAALTNNWSVRPSDEPSSEPGGDDELRQEFDVFVESSVVGLRKPDPRIYTHVCEQLGVGPSDAVFLDDIGRNLKTARSLGMRTIKVDDPGTALEELSAQLGFTLG